jgi:hypothetical protein
MSDRNMHNEHHSNIPEASRKREHELRDPGYKGLFALLASLAVLVVGAWLSMEALFAFFEGRRERSEPPPSPLFETAFPSQPRLETEPGVLLQELRMAEDTLLNSYEWTDRATGKLRIPIERAIDVIAEHGLPPVEGISGQQEEESEARNDDE